MIASLINSADPLQVMAFCAFITPVLALVVMYFTDRGFLPGTF